MKTHILAILSLLTVLLAACASAEAQTQPSPVASPTPVLEATSAPVVASTAAGTDQGNLSSAIPAATVQVLATSRGPKLEATDPKTVSMASGGLQFVEFFEFW